MSRRLPEQHDPAGKRPAFPTAFVLGAGVWLLAVSVAAAPSAPYSITIDGGAPYFLPKAATVSAHVPVRWYNTTGTHHTITHEGCERGESCLFDSGTVPPDGSYELPGLPPGNYGYYCKLHPIMRGVLTVKESGAPSSAS
ncbi:MAG TPA: hypothetical protein VFA78_03425 [Chloroflexota bacterium]|nr:hypothetical protein [Chloroflexota bacterium]